ncbi:hypothetical protein GQ853_24170 [Vibrio parahaemolyticus]|nr:hypothetical protein [Vibrio parahaemolyticus]EIU6865417.1 hypothetical protein [Vibrio parahaemolyticus]EIU7066073.1 hypothetical protein [Vibrio parahaemolyticus]ELB2132454.1 hypothetical protein [Vibrio parahaemolyticus]ELB2240172.1 hypothetical protein [Vibrio parahaemolyticus]
MNKNLVVEWADLLSPKLNRSAYEISESGLMCYDFSPDHVEVVFEDESYCRFNHAFALENPDKGQVAILLSTVGITCFLMLVSLLLNTLAQRKPLLSRENGRLQT